MKFNKVSLNKYYKGLIKLKIQNQLIKKLKHWGIRNSQTWLLKLSKLAINQFSMINHIQYHRYQHLNLIIALANITIEK